MTSEKRYCILPFTHLEIHEKGEGFLCCPSWMRKPIGTLENQSVEEIWNSTEAQAIRDSIIDGSYRYCDKNLCPYLHSGKLPTFDELSPRVKEAVSEKKTKLEVPPHYILLAYDHSCNLSCPSCRPEKIMEARGSAAYQRSETYTKKIEEDLIKNLGEHKLILNITGSGDPFASGVSSKFLENLDGEKHPNLKIDLQTNGVLFTAKRWERLKGIHQNINSVFVSIDAATAETYPIVRREGDWKVLLENMKFLAELRKQRKINLLQARFVVQKKNYVEMEKFAKDFLKLGCDVIEFSLMIDWRSMPKSVYKDQCVWENGHPERELFLEALSKSFLSHTRIFLGNLTSYREEAIRYQKDRLSFLRRQLFVWSHRLQELKNCLTDFQIKLSKKMTN
jgi:MoaA/NifB/PqqE/SkfB family radical SAM enzyme